MIGDNLPSLPKHPKPKSKGKKPAPPKLKPGPTVEPMDVFKTVLNADAGADSFQDSSTLLEDLISKLSRPQLNKLDELVQRVQTRILESEKEQKRRTEACRKIADATLERRERSVKKEASLMLKLQKRLKTLELSRFERLSNGRINKLQVEGKKIPVETFIQKYFSDELRLIDSLMDDGTLVPQWRGQSSRSFLQSLLNDCLQPKST